MYVHVFLKQAFKTCMAIRLKGHHLYSLKDWWSNVNPYVHARTLCAHLYSHNSHIGLVDNEETAHHKYDEHKTNDVD